MTWLWWITIHFSLINQSFSLKMVLMRTEFIKTIMNCWLQFNIQYWSGLLPLKPAAGLIMELCRKLPQNHNVNLCVLSMFTEFYLDLIANTSKYPEAIGKIHGWVSSSSVWLFQGLKRPRTFSFYKVNCRMIYWTTLGLHNVSLVYPLIASSYHSQGLHTFLI